MRSIVVPPGTYADMRRRTLKEELLKKYADKIEGASMSEKERVLAAIDVEIDATIQDELKRWNSATSERNFEGFKISPFKAALIIAAFLAVLIGISWRSGVRF